MTSNVETFCSTYAKAFADSYPQLDSERCSGLIEKALAAACQDIGRVDINGAAFKLTSKRLGIKHTKKSIAEYLGQSA